MHKARKNKYYISSEEEGGLAAMCFRYNPVLKRCLALFRFNLGAFNL